MDEIVFCETCWERGRRRVATHKELRMCEPCFSGAPTCAAEEAGEVWPPKRTRTRIGLKKMNAEERRQYFREKKRQWKARQRLGRGTSARG